MVAERYRIVLRGHLVRLPEAVVEWRRREGPGETVIEGEVRDQAQLHGVLASLRALGIDLVSVNPVGAGDRPAAQGERRP